MNTFFIKFFFSLSSLLILGHVLSYSGYEIKKHCNIFGGIFVALFGLGCIIYSNIVFWMY